MTVRALAFTLAAFLLTSGTSQASLVRPATTGMDDYDTRSGGNVFESVYERVEIFRDTLWFTDLFHVDFAGTYRATLTDFAFPVALDSVALNLTTASDTLGTLRAPGTVFFDVEPGNYFISFLARAGGDSAFPEMSREYQYRDDDSSDDSHGRDDDSRDHDYTYGYSSGYDSHFGQYGIEITRVSAVPLPAAAWLFGTGLLGLIGVARHRRG